MKILAVMVRYQTSIEDSVAVRGFCTALLAHPDLAESYQLMIWDNSPDAVRDLRLPIHFRYLHSAVNLGIAGAANAAAELGAEQGYAWLLLLDQDSEVTPSFLRTLLRHSIDLLPRQEIAAIAPTVRVGSVIISPKQQLVAGDRNYPEGECGLAAAQATAINSGSMIRVAALRAVGGYSPRFWLDYSDVYIYRQFFDHGMKVWRAADAELRHDLSLLDYDRLMTPWRAANFSRAEADFNDLYNGRLENSLLTLRLFLRTIKHSIKYPSAEFARIAWEQFKYRLRFSQVERVLRLKSGRSRTKEQVSLEIASDEN